MNNLQHKHYLFTGSEKKLASYGTVIRNLCSESQKENFRRPKVLKLSR